MCVTHAYAAATARPSKPSFQLMSLLRNIVTLLHRGMAPAHAHFSHEASAPIVFSPAGVSQGVRCERIFY